MASVRAANRHRCLRNSGRTHDFYDPELLRRMFNLTEDDASGLMKDEANASAAEFELDDEDLLEVRLALSSNRKNCTRRSRTTARWAPAITMAAYEKASEHSSINTALIEQLAMTMRA